jgi:hypothetical protein
VKITFEGETLDDVIVQMAQMLAGAPGSKSTDLDLAPPVVKAQGPGPEVVPAVIPSVGNSEQFPTPPEKPVVKQRTPKQLENDERLRERAAAKKAAGLKPFEKTPKVAKAPAPAPAPAAPPPPATAESLGLDPAEVVKIRQKTIEDLQSAYANGFQKEVFELLSRFGNGAKSFRELPPESFVPIREAIDNGALT